MNDYHKNKTDECSLMLAKVPLDRANLCLFLVKYSPYTEYISRG